MAVFRSRIQLPDCGWQEHEHGPGEWDAVLLCIGSCLRMGADLATLSVTLGETDLTDVVRREVIKEALH